MGDCSRRREFGVALHAVQYIKRSSAIVKYLMKIGELEVENKLNTREKDNKGDEVVVELGAGGMRSDATRRSAAAGEGASERHQIKF